MLAFGPVLRKLRLYAIPELLARRFGKLAALVLPLIIGFLYMTPTLGMQVFGMSSILNSVGDLSAFWGIIVGFAVILVFTLVGGMPSIAWTDAV